MGSQIAVRKVGGTLSAEDMAELSALAGRVRQRLGRTAAELLAIGEDLIRAKALLGHGQFGAWLEREFALSRRSAEQFMAAARRFGGRNEVVSLLPAGAVLELSAPSVPDELVEQVLSGEVPPSVSAIREARAGRRSDDRAFTVAGTFIDHLMRVRPTSGDFAAGVAAHVLRRWKDPRQRAWFARAMRATAGLIEDNMNAKIPMLEFERTTVRRLRESRAE